MKVKKKLRGISEKLIRTEIITLLFEKESGNLVMNFGECFLELEEGVTFSFWCHVSPRAFRPRDAFTHTRISEMKLTLWPISGESRKSSSDLSTSGPILRLSFDK